ncbi:MAG: hypothetical protein HOP34_14085 [Methylococcaceae bacterium]|nr:hypothetical protein [Methylococcaceae bacterium]
MSRKSNNHDDDIDKALKSNDIDKIYFNEFAIGMSNNDMFILLRCNGREEAFLNLSHITAKSLALALSKSISNFEEKTNQIIRVSDDNDESHE